MNKITIICILCGMVLTGCNPKIYHADLPICINLQYYPNKTQIERIEISAKNLSYDIWFYPDGALRSENVWMRNNLEIEESEGPRINYDNQGNISGYAHSTIDKSIIYHSNGKIRDIVRYNNLGQRDGVAEYYTKEGVLDKRLLFRNDSLYEILLDNKLFPNPPLDMWMYLDSLNLSNHRIKFLKKKQ